LIKAMGQVVKEVPDSVLVCVGGAPKWLGKGDYWQYLEQLIKSNGLEGKVFLLDRVPNRTLPVFYSACNVFVLPSYYEAFAKVVLEAMACGKPVVVTKVGVPGGVIENRGSPTGVLVNFGSERQIADALISILQNDQMARQMGANGRARVLADFTWQKVVERIDSIYQEVASQR